MQPCVSSARECAICLEPYNTSNQKLRPCAIVPCLHTFHQQCVETLKTCAICRGPLTGKQINRAVETLLEEESNPLVVAARHLLPLANSEQLQRKAEAPTSSFYDDALLLLRANKEKISKPLHNNNPTPKEDVAVRISNQMSSQLKEIITQWSEEKLYELTPLKFSQVAIQQLHKFRTVLKELVRFRRFFTSDQQLVVNSILTWNYFCALCAIKEHLHPSEEINALFIQLFYHLQQEDPIETGKEPRNLESSILLSTIEQHQFIEQCLVLLSPIFNGENDRFLDGIEKLAGQINTKNELEGYAALLESLNLSIKNHQISLYSPIADKLYLNDSTHDKLDTLFNDCLIKLLTMIPSILGTRSCHLLWDRDTIDSYFPSNISWKSRDPLISRTGSDCFISNYLIPTLKKLGIEPCDIPGSGQRTFDYYQTALSADFSIIVMNEQLKVKLDQFNAGQRNDSTNFLGIPSQFLGNRLEDSKKSKNTFLITLGDQINPGTLAVFNTHHISSYEDQYLALLRLSASICGLSDENATLVINAFKEGCNSLYESGEVSSLPPQPRSVPNNQTALERLAALTRATAKEREEEFERHIERLTQTIIEKLEVERRKEPIPSGFNLRYNEKNLPAGTIDELIKRLSTVGIKAFKSFDIERKKETVTEIPEHYTTPETYTYTREIKHPAIYVEINNR